MTARKTASSTRIRIASALITLSVALILASSPAAGLGAADDDADIVFKPAIELLKSSSLQPKGKGKNWTLELIFNVDPNVPLGTKIQLKLEYQGVDFESTLFHLKTNKRSNVSFKWTPKARMPIDQYFLWVSIPPEVQTPKVVEALKAKEKVFPKKASPWSYYFKDKAIQVGSEVDLAREKKEIQDVFNTWLNSFLELSGEFLDEFEAAEEGKKHVTDGKLDTGALVEFLKGWMKKMGKLQTELASYPTKEPGLWRKVQAAHYQTQELGRMVGKRCFKMKLRDVLRQYDVASKDFKVPAVKGFDSNYRYRVDGEELNKKLTTIYRLLKIEPEE